MDKQQATDFIVSQLAKNRNRRDIIMTLCERTGASWNLADQFVRLVEIENRPKIVAGQSPFLIGLSVFFVLSGFGVVIYMVVEALNGVWYSLPIPAPGVGFIGIPFLGSLGVILVGLGTMAGGIVGLLRTSRSLMKVM